MSSKSFSDLGVPAEAVAALRARGLTTAFPIQELAIPSALAGKDVCGKAPTGSGKTIAFGLPLAERVPQGKSGRPTALILAPTRELAAQIEGEMVLLLGRYGRRRVAAFYGGVGFGPQLAALRKGIDVAVACPGRLADLVNRGAMSLKDVSIVVIDEADRMADMGFLPEVKRILDQVKPDRQTLLFSATLDGEVDVLVQRYQNSPVKVSIEADQAAEDRTTHAWVDARREDRVALAAHYIATYGSTVVFCRTKHGTDRVTKQLIDAGVKAVPIHGGRTQAQRDRALAAFSAGKAQALVATDVAARGIHVDDVRCVMHFDIAGSDKDYLHRSGRTGRAGADGMVVSFVTQADTSAARSIQKALGHQVSAKWGSRGVAEVPRNADGTIVGITAAARQAAHTARADDAARSYSKGGAAVDSRPGSGRSGGAPGGSRRPAGAGGGGGGGGGRFDPKKSRSGAPQSRQRDGQGAPRSGRPARRGRPAA